MRLMQVLLAHHQKGRQPGREPVPFKEVMSLKVRNKVTGAESRNKQPCCLQEMSVMFACLKRNDFEQSPCSKEITSFQQCFDRNAKERAFRKQQIAKGNLVPGAHKMTHQEATILLQRYPSN